MNASNEAVSIREATPADHLALVRLRWEHKAEDGEIAGETTFDSFSETYREQLARPGREADTVHWIAEAQSGPVGATTVRIVEKECSPGKPPGRWGYLTNVFVIPDFRNRGIGSSLLQTTMEWARSARLELLIVWPSEPSMNFYRRAGFTGFEAPLECLLDDSG